MRHRWKSIYPEDVTKEIKVEDLDAPILFWMLRHMCRFRRANDVIWRWKAGARDKSEVASIAKVRDLRNFLLDTKHKTLFEDEYNRKTAEFKKVSALN